jgi:hypothetical protein
MKRAACLDTAKALVTRHRQVQHGSFPETYGAIAVFWSTWIKARHGVALDLSAHDCAMMMGLLKVGRAAKNPAKVDNYVDQAGYTALACEHRRPPAKRKAGPA